MNLSQIPREVLDRILLHLSPPDISNDYGDVSERKSNHHPLAPYSTVSRTWQTCVEARLFAHVRLTPQRLREAPKILRPTRLETTRRIVLDIVLDRYDISAWDKPEDDQCQRRNNQAITIAIRALFNILAPLNGNPNYREIVLAAHSPSDFTHEGVIPIGLRRYISSYLELVEPKALPDISCIQTLIIRQFTRRFAPATVCKIAANMSGLRRIAGEFDDAALGDWNLRMRLREGKYLLSYIVATLPKP